MRVAFFTHHFLEPTHHAIAQVMARLPECSYTVFAKRFGGNFSLPNVVARVHYSKGPVSGLSLEAYDLAHSIYDGKTALRAGLASVEAELPFVLSFHGGFDIHAKIVDPRYRDATRRLVERADAVTVPANADVERLRAIGIRRAVDVLPVPIELERLPPPTTQHAHHLVLAGRLIPKKGVDVAITALTLLPQDELIVVGEGDLRSLLETHAERCGVRNRVHFEGLLPLDGLLDRLAAAFALLHPARVASDGNAEGTPQIILWAQALGVPVIAARSGTIEEIVRDGETGLLVPPESPVMLASAVRRLRAEPSVSARLRRRADLRERDANAVAARLSRIYARVLSAAR